jgi:hypothetical protein
MTVGPAGWIRTIWAGVGTGDAGFMVFFEGGFLDSNQNGLDN